MPGKNLGSILANMATEKEQDGSISGVVKRLRKVQLLDQFAKRLKQLASQAQDAVQIDSAMNSSSVMVAVRLRPFLKHDKTYATRESCLQIIKGNEINIEDTREVAGVKQKLHKFKFDVFLPEQVTQKRVYVATAKRILVKVLRGYNGTIFAYGQTGSGKTHTMLGDESDRGIIPRVGNDLMAEVERSLGKTAFNISASFVEIYREKICDLLADVDDTQMAGNGVNALAATLKAAAKFKAKRAAAAAAAAGSGSRGGGHSGGHGGDHHGRKASLKPKTKIKGGDGWDAHNKPKKKGQDLKVRENKDGVEIVGVTMHKVKKAKDITYLLDLGNNSRHVASHNLNARSSRSHVVFTLYIEQNKLSGEGGAVRGWGGRARTGGRRSERGVSWSSCPTCAAPASAPCPPSAR